MNPGAAKRWLGMVGLALCLAACGGGSGGDGDSTGGGGGTGSETPGGPGPNASDGTTANAINPNESATLLADIELASNGTAALRVWDPAQPGIVVASQSPVPNSELVQYSWARSVDTRAGTERQTAQVLAFHAGNGRVWMTDLRGGTNHRPRPLSALDGVDATKNVVPMGLDGLSAWVNVTRSGVAHAVHTGMGSSTPALRGKVMAGLPDSSGAMRYVAVVTSNDAGQSSLVVLRADGSDAGFAPVDGGGEEEVYWVGLDPSQAGRAYVVANKQLRRLTWTDTTVSLDASYSQALSTSTHKFAGSFDGGLWVLSGSYGPVVSIEGDSMRTLGTFVNGSSVQYLNAGNAIVAEGSYAEMGPPSVPITCCTAYEAMDKTTGATKVIATFNFSGHQLLAAGDGKVTFSHGDSWRVVDTTGQVLAQGLSNDHVLGLVFSAEKPAGGEPALQALMVCTWNTATGRCGAGLVTQVSLDGAVRLVLGEVPAGSSLDPPFRIGRYVAGLPSAISAASHPIGSDFISNRDLWQFTPGVAGSLQRVTQHLP